MLKIRKLLHHFPALSVRGSKEIDITGISSNSKTIGPGNLFIAKKGIHEDGANYIPEAVSAGATSVLTDLYNPFLPSHVTQLIYPKVHEIAPQIAALYYEFPSDSLFVIGVTGTNGKTTTTFLIRHLLSTLEAPCGLIGTIEWAIGTKIQPSQHTTPDTITNYKLLREMINERCKSAAMEISSHALDQGRVEGVRFQVAIFTNLTQDHLDYHMTMDRYAEAKGKLFEMLGPKEVALLNGDDPYMPFMKKLCKGPCLTYGFQEGVDLLAKDVHLQAQGTVFTLVYQGKECFFYIPLIGRHNVSNALSAIGAALVYGMHMEEIQEKIKHFSTVPGRLERVESSYPFYIFVDYAHTDDALANVLRTLQEWRDIIAPSGRIILVFGCGGERDVGKRAKMGRVATMLADYSIITSDNPRGEIPASIIEDILSGCTHPGRYSVEIDRKMAIEKAIAMAQPSDIILIAGKGHERYQTVGFQHLPFDDREVAKEALSCTNL